MKRIYIGCCTSLWFALPEGFGRPKIRCPACGKYAEVPRDAAPPPPDAPRRRANATVVADEPPARPRTPAAPPVPAARRRADPRDRRPEFTPAGGGGTPVLAGTQDEDDEQPYAVPGTGLSRCPHCREELPLDASFCVHCGTTIAGKRKATKVFQPMAGEYVEGLPLAKRYGVLAGLQVVSFAVCILGLVTEATSANTVGGVIGLALFQLLQLALQAGLVGSFDTLTVSRTAKGKATLTVQRRLGFYKLKPQKVAWRECTNLMVTGGNPASMIEWAIFLYLFLFTCVPGVIFYFIVIHPERFEIKLTDEYGATRDTVFHTTDRELAGDVAHFLGDATGLHYRAV